jgi:DNA-binding transcriptional ArsR family regulator
MAKYSNAQVLNLTYQALADPTRRAVVSRLTRGPSSVTELAKPFDMALPSFLQHVRVLEEAGLVSTSKEGRTRVVSLDTARLKRAEAWLEKQRSSWEARFDRFDEVVNRLNAEEQQ